MAHKVGPRLCEIGCKSFVLFTFCIQRDVHQLAAVRLEGILEMSKLAIPFILHPLVAFLYRFIRPITVNSFEISPRLSKSIHF